MGKKTMDIEEFRSEGYLQEVNRRFFHPLGMALYINKEADGRETLGGIFDSRDDSEGYRFAHNAPPDEIKKKNIQDMWDEKEVVRRKVLGYMIQGEK